MYFIICSFAIAAFFTTLPALASSATTPDIQGESFLTFAAEGNQMEIVLGKV